MCKQPQGWVLELHLHLGTICSQIVIARHVRVLCPQDKPGCFLSSSLLGQGSAELLQL